MKKKKREKNKKRLIMYDVWVYKWHVLSNIDLNDTQLDEHGVVEG